MKKLVLFSIPIVLFLVGFAFITIDGPRDSVSPNEKATNTMEQYYRTGTSNPGTVIDNPDAVLYDRSELISHPGAGFGGADASAIEPPGTTYGPNMGATYPYRIADKFVVPAGKTWTIDSVLVYGYQTGSTTISSMTSVTLRIWKGIGPDTTGAIVAFGDTITNRMASTRFTNIYRVTATTLTNNQRPIMVAKVTVGTTLTEGTYWLDYNMGGTIASGPWCPVRTILGTLVTGEARQRITTPSLFWQPVVDPLPNYKGAPFRIYGTENNASLIFCDNFDSYTVGQRLACQDSIHWTTWSHLPCNTTEDALISSAQAFSPTKSVVIVANNDLVKELGNATTGIHLITFKFYVPTGNAGYFNTLAGKAPSFPDAWAMEVYFDATTGNNGRLTGGSATAVPFAYTHDSWQTMKLVVNLDIDSARFVINGSVIHTWRWTAGTGTAVPLRLAANDFFGATATDEMYVDDYCYDPNGSWIITGVTQNGNTVPTEYTLSQNYPNPFNPTTKINFALPKSGLVTLKVYDVLGKEVATLVNSNMSVGSYSFEFNASNLTSGIYFYRLESNGFIDTKKMVLIK